MSEKENNPFNSEPNNFGLPGGYFQKSAGSIFNKIEWQDEHKDYPELLRYKNKNAFIVPEQYFDKNESKLELTGFSGLAAVKKQNPFTVPQDYFEDAATVLFSENLSTEQNELQSFEKLDAVAKQNNFKTPAHYFNDNKISLATLLEVKKQGKTVKLFSVKTMYAAAATLVIALGLWTYTFYSKPVEVEDCGTIACIDRIDLVKTKTLENLDNDELYEIVNTSKLEENLNSGTGKNNDTKTDSSSKSNEVDDMLDEI